MLFFGLYTHVIHSGALDGSDLPAVLACLPMPFSTPRPYAQPPLLTKLSELFSVEWFVFMWVNVLSFISELTFENGKVDKYQWCQGTCCEGC